MATATKYSTRMNRRMTNGIVVHRSDPRRDKRSCTSHPPFAIPFGLPSSATRPLYTAYSARNRSAGFDSDAVAHQPARIVSVQLNHAGNRGNTRLVNQEQHVVSGRCQRRQRRRNERELTRTRGKGELVETLILIEGVGRSAQPD